MESYAAGRRTEMTKKWRNDAYELTHIVVLHGGTFVFYTAIPWLALQRWGLL
jgi:hypothetical protein